jgi:hypothetical protein
MSPITAAAAKLGQGFDGHRQPVPEMVSINARNSIGIEQNVRGVFFYPCFFETIAKGHFSKSALICPISASDSNLRGLSYGANKKTSIPHRLFRISDNFRFFYYLVSFNI